MYNPSLKFDLAHFVEEQKNGVTGSLKHTALYIGLHLQKDPAQTWVGSRPRFIHLFKGFFK